MNEYLNHPTIIPDKATGLNTTTVYVTKNVLMYIYPLASPHGRLMK